VSTSEQPAFETEQSFRDASGPAWRAEPFRLFFPLGVALAWIGVGHWLLYGLGVTRAYSCELHGFVQMQGFLMAFAVGFLFTALPRRTRSAPPSTAEIVVMAVALAGVAAGALAERWELVQAGYVGVFVVLLQFAARRFLGAAAGRRPPAAFVLIPIGVLHGLAGAAFIALASAGRMAPWGMRFGRLLVEQGVFLCFVVGVGSLILPLMSGTPPPADLGSSPAERRRAFAFAGAGAAILASFVLEQAGWPRGGPLVRALVVATALALGAGAHRPPGKPGFHRRLVWLATWLVPTGLAVSALWPDYRVPALHILFIGGFGLMAFGVATHVSLGHLGLEAQALGRPPAVVIMAVGFFLALAARLAADASDTYFTHLSWAAAAWLLGSLAWVLFLAPRLLGRRAEAVPPSEKR
jgi:uncharacterized protein involved in response to NO